MSLSDTASRPYTRTSEIDEAGNPEFAFDQFQKYVIHQNPALLQVLTDLLAANRERPQNLPGVLNLLLETATILCPVQAFVNGNLVAIWNLMKELYGLGDERQKSFLLKLLLQSAKKAGMRLSRLQEPELISELLQMAYTVYVSMTGGAPAQLPQVEVDKISDKPQTVVDLVKLDSDELPEDWSEVCRAVQRLKHAVDLRAFDLTAVMNCERGEAMYLAMTQAICAGTAGRNRHLCSADEYIEEFGEEMRRLAKLKRAFGLPNKQGSPLVSFTVGCILHGDVPELNSILGIMQTHRRADVAEFLKQLFKKLAKEWTPTQLKGACCLVNQFHGSKEWLLLVDKRPPDLTVELIEELWPSWTRTVMSDDLKNSLTAVFRQPPLTPLLEWILTCPNRAHLLILIHSIISHQLSGLLVSHTDSSSTDPAHLFLSWMTNATHQYLRGEPLLFNIDNVTKLLNASPQLEADPVVNMWISSCSEALQVSKDLELVAWIKKLSGNATVRALCDLYHPLKTSTTAPSSVLGAWVEKTAAVAKGRAVRYISLLYVELFLAVAGLVPESFIAVLPCEKAQATCRAAVQIRAADDLLTVCKKVLGNIDRDEEEDVLHYLNLIPLMLACGATEADLGLNTGLLRALKHFERCSEAREAIGLALLVLTEDARPSAYFAPCAPPEWRTDAVILRTPSLPSIPESREATPHRVIITSDSQVSTGDAPATSYAGERYRLCKWIVEALRAGPIITPGPTPRIMAKVDEFAQLQLHHALVPNNHVSPRVARDLAFNLENLALVRCAKAKASPALPLRDALFHLVQGAEYKWPVEAKREICTWVECVLKAKEEDDEAQTETSSEKDYAAMMASLLKLREESQNGVQVRPQLERHCVVLSAQALVGSGEAKSLYTALLKVLQPP